MNGLTRLSHKILARRVTGALAIAVALGGCADLRRAATLPPVNPESPVAAVVGPASRGSYATPRLTDVPPLPKNVASADTVKAGVLSLVRCRGGLERFPVTHPPLSRGTEQFAANARDVAQVNPADVPPPDSAARTDAFAAGLRAAVEPPAAIPSGPPLAADQSRPPTDAPPPHAAAPARAPRRRAAAPKPAAAPSAASSPAAPPPAAVQTAAAPAAPARVVETNAAPPLPPPLPDPLLARCT